MKKYTTPHIDYDVPEEATMEDQKSQGNSDEEVEGITPPKEKKEVKSDESDNINEENSLFAFNFLNDDNSASSGSVQPPK